MRLVLTLFFCLSVGIVFGATPKTSPATKLLESAPIRFEPNTGMQQKSVRWIARGQGYAFGFTDQGALLRIADRTVRLTFPGAKSTAKFEGVAKQAVATNYFIEEKRLSIPAYSRLRESGVYPGIDIVYYGTGREIEYDFEVAPGADASRIRMRFDGADRVSLNDRGELVLALGSGEITQHAPSVYQRRDSGEIIAVNAHYRMNQDGSVGVDLAGYDRAAKLIVDPTITYSAYLSGSGTDEGVIVTHNAKGLVYMAGDTVSSDFPLAGTSAQEFTGGSQDVWLMILDPSQPATAIQYATYLGGGADEFVKGMVIDQNGVFYVTGSTDSGAFPVTASAITSTNAANTHGFVSMVDPSQGASGLIYSTYLGGTKNDEGDGIAVANGKIYVTGTTSSDDFTLAGTSFQATRAGDFDAFVVEIDPTQSGAASEVVGTFLGGVNADAGHTILLDANGLVYVAGTTYSTGFPITGNAYQPGYHGGGDGFLAVLNLAAGTQTYGTFLGGSSEEEILKMTMDPKGRLVMTGYTLSFDYPVTQNAYQSIFGGVANAFISVLDLTLSRQGAGLTYSTFYGGSGGEVAYDIKIDAQGRYYICGYTLSPDLPVTANALNPASDFTGLDGFIAVIDPTLNNRGLVYGSYVTAPGFQYVNGIDVDAAGNIYVIGLTTANVFPNAAPPNNSPGKITAFFMIFTLP
jgi:hypothetical protein